MLAKLAPGAAGLRVTYRHAEPHRAVREACRALRRGLVRGGEAARRNCARPPSRSCSRSSTSSPGRRRRPPAADPILSGLSAGRVSARRGASVLSRLAVGRRPGVRPVSRPLEIVMRKSRLIPFALRRRAATWRARRSPRRSRRAGACRRPRGPQQRKGGRRALDSSSPWSATGRSRPTTARRSCWSTAAQWKQGQPAGGLADKARTIYGARHEEFIDNVKAFAYFPVRRGEGRRRLPERRDLDALPAARRRARSVRRHPVQPQAERRLPRRPLQRQGGQPRALDVQERQAELRQEGRRRTCTSASASGTR